MSITLDKKDVDVFKLYDEMAIAYAKDIEGYKVLIDAIEVMIAQKQGTLQDIKNKTIDLIKTSLEVLPAQVTPLRQKSKKAVFEITQSMPVKEQSRSITPPIQVQKPRPARHKKTTGKGKVKRAEKPNKPSLLSKNIAEESKDNQLDTSLKKISKTKSTNVVTETCLYHPKSPVLDKARQLCSSCKWKLITNGLKKYDKEPSVISFLKGEITKIPDLGQSMCPVHPAVPSYNKKSGLCKDCQKKAKAIGVQDRHLTEEELKVLRIPVS